MNHESASPGKQEAQMMTPHCAYCTPELNDAHTALYLQVLRCLQKVNVQSSGWIYPKYWKQQSDDNRNAWILIHILEVYSKQKQFSVLVDGTIVAASPAVDLLEWICYLVKAV